MQSHPKINLSGREAEVAPLRQALAAGINWTVGPCE